MTSNNRVFPISPQALYYILRDSARSAGLGHVAPHDLRRSYARLSRAGGAPLEQVQQTLGHASLQTTQRYLGSEIELRPGLACGDYIDLEGD